jgi:hypothetical protein
MRLNPISLNSARIFCGVVIFSLLMSSTVLVNPSRVLADQDCNANVEATDVNAQVGWRVTKGKSEGLVGLIVSKYKPGDAEFTEAQKLYLDAQVKYNAYLDGALLQMVKKQKGDLTPSAKEACEASAKFQNYVDQKTSSKGFLAFLPVIKELVGWGIDLYDKHKDKKEKQRQSIADALKPQVKWKAWAEIVKENKP